MDREARDTGSDRQFDGQSRQLVPRDHVPAVRHRERDGAHPSGGSGSRRRRRRRRSRGGAIALTDDPFEQGVLAVGAAILFALVVHMLTPGSGFLSHLPSGWLGLFPALLCFDSRSLPNKLLFGCTYLALWFMVAGLIHAASQGLLH